MIKGVSVTRKNSATACLIDFFSDELKAEIRERLSAICHGPDIASSGSIVASYRETLKEFNKRYAPKTENTKKGMIGELLTHILLLKACPELEPANPFFNMEESSIKKGFDLIVFDINLEKMWVTEVKSGSAGTKSANTFNKALLNTAKNDLENRFADNETHIWLNAINGARQALSTGTVKDRINEILEECYQEASDEEQDGSEKNVILVSVTYKHTSDPVLVEEIKEKRKKILEEELFGEVMVFSIQKETYELVAAFLESEAEQ
ncbi:Hachiman antiphage defense system protein HamA [Congregibacter brevis]|uniref:Hachiman antiphage defense system protein HamA n=1 Tax=Congregibacter brevis TaxID=3081201 RepID=A0ABZ0IGI7_9GAMM|nr:Hachiman antiphage defense system protein HamA [Congregibacter sp. IMCC45268]